MKAVTANNAIAIEPGKTNDIKINITRRHGFQSKLALSVKGLPEGLGAEPVDVPEKSGEVALKLVASAEAKPFSGAIQITLAEVESGLEHRVLSDLTSSTVDNGVPQGFKKLVIESMSELWLTVLPAPVKQAPAEKRD